MKEEIKKNLDNLKSELDKLTPAILHLQNADKNANELISSFSKMNDVYATHLHSIEKLLVDSNKEHQIQITKELNTSTSKLNDLGEKISNSFSDLEEDLNGFVDKYKSLAEESEKIASKIDKVDFPTRLDKIENTVKETILILNKTRESTIEELKKASENIIKADFDGRFKKLQFAVDTSVKSNTELAKSIENQRFREKIDGFEKTISSRFLELRDKTEEFTVQSSKSIRDLNLPIRIDKLDSTISSINQGIQNLQQRIGDLERNLKDDLLSKQKELIAKIESAETSTKLQIDNSYKEVTKMFDKISKENRFLKILFFVSIALTVGLIAFNVISGT